MNNKKLICVFATIAILVLFSSCAPSSNSVKSIPNSGNGFVITKTGVLAKYNGTDKNIIIPNGVTSIGEYAFTDFSNSSNSNSSTISITIPNSVTSIGKNAFSGCENLIEITIPNSVTSIGKNAFNSCTNLIEITIPNSVTSIGEGAFCYCTSLVNISIPSSVNVKTTAPLSEISDDSPEYYGVFTYTEIDKPIILNNGTYLCYVPTSYRNYTVPSGVTSIGDHAFADCTELTNVTIPNSVTSIGDCAFSDCSSLSDVTVLDSVTYISKSAFTVCPSLNDKSIETIANIQESSVNSANSFFSFFTLLVVIGVIILLVVAIIVFRLLRNKRQLSAPYNTISSASIETWVCRCGAVNEKDALFCGNCGTKREQ